MNSEVFEAVQQRIKIARMAKVEDMMEMEVLRVLVVVLETRTFTGPDCFAVNLNTSTSRAASILLSFEGASEPELVVPERVIKPIGKPVAVSL